MRLSLLLDSLKEDFSFCVRQVFAPSGDGEGGRLRGGAGEEKRGRAAVHRVCALHPLPGLRVYVCAFLCVTMCGRVCVSVTVCGRACVFVSMTVSVSVSTPCVCAQSVICVL